MVKKLFFSFILYFFSFIAFANTPPTLSNFRIDETSPNRVYFDSSEPLTASNANGFIVSHKNITGITINTDQTVGHYVTVDSPFTFWDNNTIRYEGGSDIQDTENEILHEFTLSYIENNIPEPASTDDRYVTTSASGGGDGLSEATAWTWAESMSKAAAGQTVWIKAGDYGNLNLNFGHRIGTAENPIKFIGYKNSIGDIVDNYWDYGITFDTSEMPTLSGATTESGNAFFMYNNHYVIMRNIQIQRYKFGFLTYPNSGQPPSEYVIFDNFNGREFGSKTQPNGTMFNINQLAPGYTSFIGNDNFRVTNAVIQNFSMSGVSILGDGRALIDNVKAYNDGIEKPDYQIFVNGHHNIIRNCHIEIVNDYYSPSTHGIGIRGNINLSNTYNLIEKSTAVNMNEGFYIRNYGSNYNVIKDCVVKNNGATNGYRGGVYIWGGADYNIVERLEANDVYTGIGFKDNNEEGNVNDNTIGKHNIIRNSTFHNFVMAISVVQQTSGATGAVYDNKIINCTFNNGNWMFQLYFEDIKNLDFINCSITNVNYPFSGGLVYQNKPISGVNYTNCNFYNNNFPNPVGTNIYSLDPKYVDEPNGNLRLQPDSELIDKGIVDPDVNFDFDKQPRPQGTAPDIGAFEDQSNVPGVGADFTICNGADAVLVATGGDSYLWDNGETTETITVTPTVTTTYSVDITNATETSTHSITITVNESPVANAGEDVTSCSGSDVILTASGGDTYEWSNGETTESITVSPTDTTTYTVIASNDGCTITSSDDVLVTVEAIPALNGGVDVEMCVGETIVLTATGSDNYLWSTGETTDSITISPTETTTYTVTSTLASCSVTDEVIVTVNEAPTVNAGEDSELCSGESILLTATGVGNFLWSNGETTASITVSPTTTTTYTVTASNNCGTEVTDDVIVTVNEMPVVDLGTDVEICIGDSITLTATGTGDTFIWNTGETTNSITISPTDTATYSVTSTLNTCSVTDEIVVTVNEIPSVSLGDDVAICSGESVVLTAVASGGNFVWSTGETGTSITINPTTTTTYTISSTNTACGSDVSDEITVSVTEKPVLTVSPNVEICRGESVTLTATGTGDSYFWNTGETTSSITVSPTETFVYSVSNSNGGSCSVTEEIVVTVNDVPTVNLGPDTTICSGENITLTAVGTGDFLWSTGETGSSIVINPSTTTTYSIISINSACGANVSDEITITVNESPTISVSDDITICDGDSTTLTATGTGTFLWSTGETTASITVNPSTTTNYTVTSSLNGCTATDNVLVTVDETPTVNLGTDVSICTGENITLTATGIGNFVWSTGETTPSITVSPTSTTTYSVTSTNGVCSGSSQDEILVTVNEVTNISAGDDVSICSGESTILTATGSGSFLWSTGETSNSITVNPSETTTYTLTVTSIGCSASDDVIVTVNSTPVLDAGSDRSICNGETVTLTASGASNYVWSSGETTESITVNPSVTTIYTVSSTNSCGNSQSDEVEVIVNEIIEIDAGDDVSVQPEIPVTLTASGADSYLWSTGETTQSITVSPESTTTYTVSNPNSACHLDGTVTVTIEDPIDLDGDSDPNGFIYAGIDVEICTETSVVLTVTGGSLYLWSTGETTASITVNPTETTTYSVTGSDGVEIGSDEVTVFVNEECSGLASRPENQEILLYPNPTEDILNIELTGFRNDVKISLYSFNGSLIYSENVDNNRPSKVLSRKIDLSRFSKGVYFVRLTNNGNVETKKVLVI